MSSRTLRPSALAAATLAAGSVLLMTVHGTHSPDSGFGMKLASSNSYLPSRPSGPSGYWGSPVAADTFTTNGGRIDRNLWGYGSTLSGNGTHYGAGNNSWESQVYANTGENVSAIDGLTLTASPQSHTVDGRDHSYLSGAINSRPPDPGNVDWTAKKGFTFNPSKATFTLEASIKVDGNYGNAWPAFWFVPTGYTWPPEVDILEFLTGASDQGIPEAHIHWSETVGGSDNQLPYFGSRSPQWATGYHKYTATIGPGGAFFYVDGNKIGSMTDSHVLSKILNYDYYIIINQAITGNPGTTMKMQTRYFAAWEQGNGGLSGGGYAAGTNSASAPAAAPATKAPPAAAPAASTGTAPGGTGAGTPGTDPQPAGATGAGTTGTGTTGTGTTGTGTTGTDAIPTHGASAISQLSGTGKPPYLGPAGAGVAGPRTALAGGAGSAVDILSGHPMHSARGSATGSGALDPSQSGVATLSNASLGSSQPQNRSSAVPLAVGLVLGLLCLHFLRFGLGAARRQQAAPERTEPASRANLGRALVGQSSSR